MSDYLGQTERAYRALFDALSDMREPVHQWERNVILLEDTGNYLTGIDRVGRGDWYLHYFREVWEEEPTPEAVQKWKAWNSDMLAAAKSSANVICGSMLMIAQNGVKLVLGKPSSWSSFQNQVISNCGECVLQAIWHGRNQMAHVEGLKRNGDTYKYFTSLKSRRGVEFDVDLNFDSMPERMVCDILGWVDPLTHRQLRGNDWRFKFEGDMLALGALVGR